jgi:hypothetical protein
VNAGYPAITPAIASAVVLAAGAPRALRADELSELRAAVIALQKRVEELESRSTAVDATNDRQTDQIVVTKRSVPAWVPSYDFGGDLRYRNETIDQEFLPQNNRGRIRVRFGVTAEISDTLRTEFQLATSEGNDPRSANVTLTGLNSRKSIDLDLAYVEWQPLSDWRLTAGKMRGPWLRPGQSLLIDGDVNPEGLAASFVHGDFFADGFYNILEERAADQGSALIGGQVGWRPVAGESRFTLGAGYYNFTNVQGRDPFYNGPNGNTVTSAAGSCKGSISTCLVYDYDILQVFGEWSVPVAGRPLALYGDGMQNTEAGNGLATAWSAGVMYGRASDPRTWEIGYQYQLIEKDAVFGQLVDSDFGAGNTDARGSVIRLGYAPARNWVINAWYHFGQTNLDDAASVPGVGQVYDRDYERLKIDLNFRH